MASNSWIYDAIIYIYALSLLFFFSDFARQNRSAKRMGAGLLIFVWVLQTIFFIIRMIEHRYMPVLTLFEVLFFFSWLLVTVSLVMSRFFRMDFIVFFVNVIGFAILTLNIFSNLESRAPRTHGNVVDELLIVHSSLAILSYAVFTISAIFAGMYLFLHFQLKSKQWSMTVRRFPSLETIDYFTNMSAVVGTPLLIMALTLGIMRIMILGDWSLLLDMKVWTSIFVLAAYSYYLWQRASANRAGDQLALWNLAAFGIIIVNFAINYVSGFHHWDGA
ncbi:cytochrome C assembly protein [Paenibacillus swuensis]|uniref:Cytochrome C assembly protein n=1 Tax=Paenibacillus swuensis TaxID=1178515 RepID=A0A172TJK9_9BACL|nr:cytochrome c biogenesis protein CcsA [Paenibacillus swuensis]ANE47152.1 cytochrome C assembly protein [Paenibacillus swuensis]